MICEAPLRYPHGKLCAKRKGHKGTHRSAESQAAITSHNREMRRQHPLYNTWSDIKKRCYNPHRKGYLRYGGRGISMYAPWREDFPAFEAWINENLGPRPDGCSLDRIDNDGNYEPCNLRWANDREQAANREVSLRRDLPLGVHVQSNGHGFMVMLGGFSSKRSAMRAATAALAIRDREAA